MLKVRHAGRLVLVALVATLAALVPALAAAHPLGNFTINRYSHVELAANQTLVRYIIDMAEIPALQERQKIDTDSDGILSQVEQNTYRDALARTLAANLALTVAGQQVALLAQEATLSFPAGQGGLETLRLEMNLVSNTAADGQAEFRDTNFVDRIGWSEVIVVAGQGMAVRRSTVPDTGISDELRSYPANMLDTPSSITTASFEIAPVAPGEQVSTTTSPISTSYPQANKPVDNLAALVAVPLSSPWGLLAALAAALGLGAAHALAPGHGKTIVAAYLVGTRGTAWHALFLGLTTTITHTAGVFALGLLTLFVSRYILPEQLYPWLSVASGVMVALIGIGLLRQRLSSARTPHAQAEGVHSHGFGVYHSHTQPDSSDQSVSANRRSTTRRLLLLGISGGLIPCPSALVLLLGAIAAGRTGLGLGLVVAFSFGLAVVLTAIGLVLVYARHLFVRLPVRGFALRYLPVASALIVTLAGGAIAVQALISMS